LRLRSAVHPEEVVFTVPKRLLTALFAIAVALTSFTLPVVPAAQAATATTGSCVDGAGRTWRTKVVWDGVITAPDGTRRKRVTYAGWTTGAGNVSTVSAVRTYDGSGALLQTLRRSEIADYAQGTVWKSQDPLDPPNGGAKVTISVGTSGQAPCTVTHRQKPSSPSVGASAATLASFNALDTLAGPLVARRAYDGALPRSFSASAAAADVAARRTSYWSFAPNVATFASDPAAQAAFSAFLDTNPAGHKTVIVAWHEPEDNIYRGQFTLAQWGATNNKVGQIIRSKRRPELRLGICLMGPWTFDIRSPYYRYDWKAVLNFDLVDVVGIDPYKFHTTDPSIQKMLTVPNYGTGGTNPSTMQRLLAWGKPVALMEWGVVATDVTSGAAISDASRAAFIRDAHAWMKAWNDRDSIRIEAALYFHLNVSAGDSLLSGQSLEAFAATTPG
jgi:hypothetical protein